MFYAYFKKPVAGCFIFLTYGFLLAVAGCTASTTGDPAQKNALRADTGTSSLLLADAVLHQKLQAVLDADDVYNELISTNAPTADLDEKNGRIIQAEMALQQTIDSLEQQKSTDTAAAKDQLQQLTGYFKNALRSRRALSDLRMVLSADSDDSTTAQQMVKQLRAELLEKNKRIAALEQGSKTTTQQERNRANIAANEPGTYAPAKGETPADLKQRNKNLALALSSLQTKYFVLGRDYLVLKKEHERTVAELAALRKAANQK